MPIRSVRSVAASRRMAGHTENIRQHLKSIHGIIEAEPLPPQRRSVLELQRHAPAASHRSELSDADNSTIVASKFRAALIAFICCTHIAFSIVESGYFQAFLSTISRVIESYKQRKEQIKGRLRKARSRIHLRRAGP